MTKVLALAGLAATLLAPGTVVAKRVDKVVYGQDNREETAQYGDRVFRQKAQSVAMMVKKLNLSNKDGTYELSGKSFKERAQLCEGERFSEQMSVGSCTAFLVGPTTLVTAGHCTPSTTECQKYNFVFGFTKGKTQFSQKDVYSCKRVVRHQLDQGPNTLKRDWAIVELDRPVLSRKPLKFRTKGAVKKGEELVIIGHPVGLPQKIADKAFVRDGGSNVYMVASTDSYGGNSGSPVFNQKTGDVEGILVRGERDFEMDWANNCRRSKICKQDECRGEDITRITHLKMSKKELKYKK